MKPGQFILFTITMLLLLIAAGCSKNDPINENETGPLETDPAKIIIGRWKFSKYFWGWEDKDGIKTTVYRDAKVLRWVELSSNGDYILEYYNDVHELETYTGKFWIDSLLHYNNFLLEPWFYEFSNNNNSLKLSNAFPAFSPIEDIYIREK
ncbi:MAG: hypothetical protein HQ541_16540 [Mariniphaga sp.]|nr:hypothetical protein [Mariniphaga sp.]